MTRISLFAASTTVALAAGLSAALASTPGPYISTEAGASFIPDQSLSGTPAGTLKEGLDPGYAVGGAIGYDFGDGKRIELESLTTRANLSKIDGLGAGGHLDATGLMLNGTIDLMPHAATTPYIGAGLGFQNVGAVVAGMHGQNWEPAYQLEAGIRHYISPKISLFGEYRYTQAEASTLHGGGASAHQHFTNNALLVGVSYHFGG